MIRRTVNATVARRPGSTARTATAIALAEIGSKLATLALIVVSARVLVQEDFGAFGYALSFALLVTVVPALGFNTTLTRQGARHPDQLATALTQNLLWRALLGIPVMGVAAAAGVATRPDATAAIVLVLVLLAAGLDLHDTAWRAAAAALDRQVAVHLALVVQRVTTAVTAVVVLLAGGGVVGLAAAYLGGSLVGSAVVLVIARRLGIRPAPLRVGAVDLWPALRESAVIGLHAIVAMALFRIDAVMIGLLVGDDEVAVHTAAYRLLETVTFLAWAVSRATFPKMAAAATHPQVAATLRRGISVLLLAYLPIGVLLLLEAPTLIELVFGERYASSAGAALRWLAPAPALFGLAFLTGRALTAIGSERLTLAASAAALLGNVCANLIVIPRYGAAGAAATTTGSYLLQALVITALARRRLGPLGLTRPAVAPAAAAAAAAALLLAPLPDALGWPLAAAAAASTGVAVARWMDPAGLRAVLPARVAATLIGPPPARVTSPSTHPPHGPMPPPMTERPAP